MLCPVARFAMRMFVLDKDGFVCKVSSKGDSGYSKARERSLEAIPP